MYPISTARTRRKIYRIHTATSEPPSSRSFVIPRISQNQNSRVRQFACYNSINPRSGTQEFSVGCCRGRFAVFRGLQASDSWGREREMDMGDGDEGEERRVSSSRPISAMGIEIEPDLEAPLLGTLESSTKPPSRVAPLLVLFAFIVVVILLAATMGNLSSHLQSMSPAVQSAQPP